MGSSDALAHEFSACSGATHRIDLAFPDADHVGRKIDMDCSSKAISHLRSSTPRFLLPILVRVSCSVRCVDVLWSCCREV